MKYFFKTAHWLGYCLSHVYIKKRKKNGRLWHDGDEIIRAIMDNAADAIISTDKSGVIESFNAAGEYIFGYQAREIIGQNVNVLMPYPIHSKHDDCIKNYLKTGKAKIIGFGSREVEGKKKNGEIFPVDLAISEFHLNGEAKFIGIARDITEKRVIEQQKIELTDAKHSNHLADEFLSGMSHELRSPLTSVIGYAERIPAKIKQQQYDKAVKFAKSIDSSATQLLGIINDILDYNKIKVGKIELQFEDIYVADILTQLNSQYRLQAEEKKINLMINIPEKSVLIYADRLRLTQILSNIFSNAIKFTPRNGKISVDTYFNGKLQISVTDNGVGIETRDQSVMFDRFRQVGRNRKDQEGTGLGLAITKRLIELHGGVINVESEPGKGSTFTVELPIRKGLDS